jgi:multidrug efflux pump subunit AcrA (membrane-fusion protein)
MLRVEINIPNDGGALKPGAFARGSITTSTQESATFVPASAVVTFAGVHRVYSIKDGKAAEHRVQLGARDGDTVQIIVDPAPDHVITTNPAALAPGRPVHAPGA